MEGLRPLGLGELLDAALQIYKRQARTLILAVAVPVVPSTVIIGLIVWSVLPDSSTDATTGLPVYEHVQTSTIIAAGVAVVALYVLSTGLATAACFRSVSCAYVGGSVTWKESLAFGFRRLASVTGLSLLVGLATFVGFLFCIAPGLWALTVFRVAVPALLVEGQGVFGAMGRSRELVKGMGWRILGISIASSIIVGIVSSAMTTPLTLLTTAAGNPVTQQVISLVLRTASLVFTMPFTAALTMAIYVDLRVRKEGFDLVLWAQRLAQAPADGGLPVGPVAMATPATGWAPGAVSTAPAPAPPPPPPPPPPPAPPVAPTGWGPSGPVDG